MVLSQGATDIPEGALVDLSRIHPIGRHRQRKRQQIFHQYEVGSELTVVVVAVVVKASVVNDIKDSHSRRDVGAIH